MYLYDTLAVIRKKNACFSFSEESESFVSALTSFFLASPFLVENVCSIYCRKPRNGDLQFMGEYDGLSVFVEKGERHSHILTLSNGAIYSWNGNRFVRDYGSHTMYFENPW